MKKEFDFKQYCLDRLFKSIPEMNNLDEPLKSELKWYQDDEVLLPHSIYESILCPYFLSLIEKDDKKSKDIMKRVASLIEDLVSHEDFNTRCIAKVGFIEPLLHKLYEKKRIKDAAKYLLPYSFEVAKEVAKNSIYRFDPKIWDET